MTRQKKNTVTLLVLCAVLAVAVIAYFLIPKGKGEDGDEKTAGTETEETITVDSIKTEDVSSVKVSAGGKETISLEKKESGWRLSDGSGAPLNEDSVKDLLACLNPVTASRSLEKTGDTDLSEYGLAEPVMTIQIGTGDGAVHRYDLGAAVPIVGGYYGLSSSGDKIYCMEEELYSAFDIEENSLITVKELPQIETGHMTAVQVDNKKGKDFAAEAVGKKERVNPDSSWNITKPYEKPLAASTSDWDTTLGYFSELSFSQVEDYNTRDLAKYGLDNPGSRITIKYYESRSQAAAGASGSAVSAQSSGDSSAGSDAGAEEIPEKDRVYRELVLNVGKEADDGYYYVCLPGKDSITVYSMDSTSVENMTGIDAFSVMDTNVYGRGIEDISGYDVTFGDTSLKVSCETTGKGEEKETTYTLKGKNVPEEDAKALESAYTLLSELTYTSKVKSSSGTGAGKKPVLTVVFHEDGRDVTVTFRPYDGVNFYAVDKDGMDYFVADKPAVDKVIGALGEISGKK